MIQAPTKPAAVLRNDEYDAVEAFLRRTRSVAEGLVLCGDAGLGKTTLWTHAIQVAADRGWTVLSCRASATERMLDFVGLGDLLSGLDMTAYGDLSTVKRRALEAVLLRGDAAEPPEADLRAVFSATMEVLARLAGRPLLIAVDDWNWLDQATASALGFAARRLGGSGPVFLLTERTGPTAPTDGSVDVDVLAAALDLHHLELAPFPPEAIRQILQAELELSLPRRRTDELHQRSGGNPFFALELGRALISRCGTAHHSDAPQLPERLEIALIRRVERLEHRAGEALLAATLGRDLSRDQLRRVVGEATLAEGERAQILIRSGDSLRPSPPLLGEVALRQSLPERRRDLHRRIADVVGTSERAAFHLAAATAGPDSAVAATVFTAAQAAAQRAAISAAVTLGEQALALTPASGAERVERLLWLAELLIRAGQLRRAGDLLGPLLDSLPPGTQRGHARYLHGWAVGEDIIADLEAALADVPEANGVRARILLTLGMSNVVGRCRALDATRTVSREVLARATDDGDAEAAEVALALLAWIDNMQGITAPDLDCEPPGQTVELHRSSARTTAVALMWRGDLAEARNRLSALLALADERGEHDSYYVMRIQLCELELRAGGWAEVARYLYEWDHDRGEGQGESAGLRRCRAMLAVGTGDLVVGADLAQGVIEDGPNQSVWHRLEALRTLGLAQLLGGDPAVAVGPLREVWTATRREGITNPGTFPVAPDLVRALIATGALDEARAVHGRLLDLAQGQDHPWARAAAYWTAGQLAQAEGDLEAAASCLTRAADGLANLGFGWDATRALVDRGTVERRLRRRAVARATLEAAVLRYEAMGCPVYAGAARTELSRLGGRTRTGSGLTPTEQRVAALVADGLSNKAVAGELVVSVGAVEAHLTRIYAKLGVRSRAELMRTHQTGTPIALTA